jgi:hypothetical protein
LVLGWGETVDNVSRYAYLEGGYLVLVFAFLRPGHPFPEDRGKVFAARIPPDEFVATIVAAADLLESESTK